MLCGWEAYHARHLSLVAMACGPQLLRSLLETAMATTSASIAA